MISAWASGAASLKMFSWYSFAVSGDCLELIAENARDRPITVAFAQGDWYQVNLYNSVGLPAIPFEIEC